MIVNLCAKISLTVIFYFVHMVCFAQDDTCLGDNGITVVNKSEKEGSYKVVSFDKWTFIASNLGGVAVHDKSPFDATIGIGGNQNGIYYSLLDGSGRIMGHVFDFDQDGFPDVKILMDGSVEIFISGGWYPKQTDSLGDFVRLDGKKVYLEADPVSKKYINKLNRKN